MDEKRLTELVKSAIELDELEAAAEGRPGMASMAGPGQQHARRRWATGTALAATAAIVAYFLLSPQLAIDRLTISTQVSRGASEQLEIVVGVSRPAYVRLLLIDTRNERWLVPIAEEPTPYERHLDKVVTLRGDVVPNPDDPRGVSRAVLAIVIASLGEAPSLEELLEAVPDPVANSLDDLDRSISHVANELETKFGCVVRYVRIPKNLPSNKP